MNLKKALVNQIRNNVNKTWPALAPVTLHNTVDERSVRLSVSTIDKTVWATLTTKARLRFNNRRFLLISLVDQMVDQIKKDID